MNRFLAAQGKQLIGWDEILEGGLAEGACVMSWRVSPTAFPEPSDMAQGWSYPAESDPDLSGRSM